MRRDKPVGADAPGSARTRRTTWRRRRSKSTGSWNRSASTVHTSSLCRAKRRRDCRARLLTGPGASPAPPARHTSARSCLPSTDLDQFFKPSNELQPALDRPALGPEAWSAELSSGFRPRPPAGTRGDPSSRPARWCRARTQRHLCLTGAEQAAQQRAPRVGEQDRPRRRRARAHWWLQRPARGARRSSRRQPIRSSASAAQRVREPRLADETPSVAAGTRCGRSERRSGTGSTYGAEITAIPSRPISGVSVRASAKFTSRSATRTRRPGARGRPRQASRLPPRCCRPRASSRSGSPGTAPPPESARRARLAQRRAQNHEGTVTGATTAST